MAKIVIVIVAIVAAVLIEAMVPPVNGKKVDDEVCKLPRAVGPCRMYLIRFYHEQETGKCEKFVYGGCQGNANNFMTLEECQQSCEN